MPVFVSVKIKAHLALTTVAIIYGLNYVIAKNVLVKDIISPFQFILLRVIAGTLLLWIFYLTFIREKVAVKDFPRLAICGLTGISINQLAFFSGLKKTTPIHASLLMTLTPILVLIIARIVLNEKMSRHRIIGILLGMSGAVYLITEGGRISVNTEWLFGDLLVFCNASFYGLYLVLVKPLIMKYHPITIITWAFTFGLFFVLPFGLPGITNVAWSALTSIDWMSIVYVLIFTTFLAYVLNGYALSGVSPTIVSIYIYLQPVIASISSVASGQENMDLIKIISGIVIIAGVIISSQPVRIFDRGKPRI